MQSLATVLGPMASHARFILYQLVPDAGRPGKTHKYPINPTTAHKHDAHDPAIWMGLELAEKWLWYFHATYGPGYGIGYVFHEDAHQWFVDIDECLDVERGDWSGLAKNLCRALSGAYIEVSQSGRGLHIIGYGPVPAHGCKNIPLHLECYHTGRFVALTGTSATGSTGWRNDAAIAAVLSAYFPPSDVVNGGITELTADPRDEWNGPTEDDELLRRAMNSKSAAHHFGGKASFADLWDANVDALAKTYPSDTGKDFDHSSADMALAQHLAFWTGCHGERMHRLMLESELYREKWDARPEYLTETIIEACRRQSQVLVDQPTPLPPGNSASAAIPATVDPITPSTRMPEVSVVKGSTYLGIEQQRQFFNGVVFVQDAHKVLVPGGKLLKPDQFRVAYGGFTFALDGANEKVTRDPYEAIRDSQGIRVERADTVCFKPREKPGAILHRGGVSAVNIWWPSDVPRAQGSIEPFWRHLCLLIPDENDRNIWLAWAATVVQFQGCKIPWCVVLQGAEGNGKTFLSRCLAQAIGDRYTFWPSAGKIGAQFNAYMQTTILCAVEDVNIPEHRTEVMEALKPMIAGGERIEIEGKGQDQTSMEICTNFILNMNDKGGIKALDSRRYCMFYTAQQTPADIKRAGMDGAYFHGLYEWAKSGGYSYVTDFLYSYKVPDHLNPLGTLTRAPETTATPEFRGRSLGNVEQEILEAIEQDEIGFRGGWVSSTYLSSLLDRLGRRVAPSKRPELLANLGYRPHPALQDGRLNNAIQPDGKKPRLYIKEGSGLDALGDPISVANAYSAAQRS